MDDASNSKCYSTISVMLTLLRKILEPRDNDSLVCFMGKGPISLVLS